MTRQEQAYEYLINRDYQYELEQIGVYKADQLRYDHIQILINDYTERDNAPLYERNTPPHEHFDRGYDLGLAQGMIGVSVLVGGR